MSSPNTDAHDRETGLGPEGRLAKVFTYIGVCLQLQKISHHQIQPALFYVQVLTMLTHCLLFSHNKGHEETSAC